MQDPPAGWESLRLVLPADVKLFPISEASEAVRTRLPDVADGWILSRPGTRARAKAIDLHAATLLAGFRRPSTFIDAVIALGQATGEDPQDLLLDALPAVRQFLSAGILAPEGSDAAAPISPSLEAGSRVAGFELAYCVHVLEDVEVYRAAAPGAAAALKRLRPGASGRAAARLAREAAVLGHLDGRAAPRLLASGRDADGLDYLATEWIDGVSLDLAAAKLRNAAGGRPALLRLAVELGDAFAALHGLGVLHGDVHPGNVIVGEGGTGVRLIDFGWSTLTAGGALPGDPGRGGVAFYFEPEHAAALLDGAPAPPVTARGEQYAVAAMTYRALTGRHRLDFRLDRREMLRQVVEAAAEPFSDQGCEPWPEVEGVLARALAPDPADRFPSVRAFADALRSAGRRSAPARGGRPRTGAGDASKAVPAFLRRIGWDGPLLAGGSLAAPTCSVAYGAAGIAYAAYRIALLRADPDLLALADVWATRAVADSGAEGAFASASLGLRPDDVPPASVFYGRVGPCVVRALVAQAMDDAASAGDALDAFLAQASGPCGGETDLTLGRAGLLLAAALLYEAFPRSSKLAAFGEAASSSLSEALSGGERADAGRPAYLGMAHGSAGALFAALRWGQATGRAPDRGLCRQLDRLAGQAERRDGAVRWRRHDRAAGGDGGQHGGGWCHGGAGHVLLWTLAHRLLGRADHLELAEGTARGICPSGQQASLCCGDAGSAYALLSLHGRNGDERLLRAAEGLARGAASAPFPEGLRDSLYKGPVGVALLLSEIDSPGRARMPLLEADAPR